MKETFVITRKDFKIWRYFFAQFLMIIHVLLCFILIPLSVPYIAYFGLSLTSKDITTGIALVLLVFFSCSIPLLITAIFEKNRFPVGIMLKNKFIVFSDKNGKQWNIRYSECRHTTAFVHCILSGGSQFWGTWAHGIVIYAPRVFLKGFPVGLYETGANAPLDKAFYLPAPSKDIPEIVAFLEKRKCVSVPSPTLSQLLTYVFAPTLFLWVHFAIAQLLIHQIGIYGFICSMSIGGISGIIFATSFVAKPYRKKAYVLEKRLTFYHICTMNALSIGLPIFLWNMPHGIPELRPSIVEAIFIILLCCAESFLWYYCVVIKRKPNGKSNS